MKKQEVMEIIKEAFDLQVMLSNLSNHTNTYISLRDKLNEYRMNYVNSEKIDDLMKLNKLTNDIKKILNDLDLYIEERLNVIG